MLKFQTHTKRDIRQTSLSNEKKGDRIQSRHETTTNKKTHIKLYYQNDIQFT